MGWWSILKRAPSRYTLASTRALSLFALSLTFCCFFGSLAFTASRCSDSAYIRPTIPVMRCLVLCSDTESFLHCLSMTTVLLAVTGHSMTALGAPHVVCTSHQERSTMCKLLGGLA